MLTNFPQRKIRFLFYDGFQTFEHQFIMDEQERFENSTIELELTVKFIGTVKDLAYLIQSKNSNCSIVPRKDGT